MRQTFRRDADSSLTTVCHCRKVKDERIWQHKPALIGLMCCGVLPKISTFGSQKCYLQRRIRSKMLAGRSQKCYFGEGIGHFQAQKSAIFRETFAGASQGLMSHCTQPTMYKYFYFKIEIQTKVDSYMPCKAMAHFTK